MCVVIRVVRYEYVWVEKISFENHSIHSLRSLSQSGWLPGATSWSTLVCEFHLFTFSARFHRLFQLGKLFSQDNPKPSLSCIPWDRLEDIIVSTLTFNLSSCPSVKLDHISPGKNRRSPPEFCSSVEKSSLLLLADLAKHEQSQSIMPLRTLCVSL